MSVRKRQAAAMAAQAKRQLGPPPPGFSYEFVKPPWDRSEQGCRSCGDSGGPGPWAVVTMRRVCADEKVVKFTFAMVCKSCVDQQERMQALADRAFSSLS